MANEVSEDRNSWSTDWHLHSPFIRCAVTPLRGYRSKLPYRWNVIKKTCTHTETGLYLEDHNRSYYNRSTEYRGWTVGFPDHNGIGNYQPDMKEKIGQ